MRPWTPARPYVRIAALVATAAFWGCRPVAVPQPPVPPPSPDLPHLPEPSLDEPEPPLERPPGEGEPVDLILGSPAARDTAFRRQVDEWTVRWTTQARGWFPLYLERMGAYEALVDETLRSEGLPASLRYLPIVESGYSPRAVSRASAVGMWQFMSPTARSLGLAVTPLVDERRDPVSSTLAAARFLAELHDRFDSWFLALAAYNGGPGRVDRLLRRHARLAPLSDELYFRIQPHLPSETAEFVPKFFAAARVARDAERYGLAPDSIQAPLTWDEVEVPDATSLDVVAEVAGVAEDDVVALNPHILRKVTPRGQRTLLRLPDGRGDGFLEAWSRIPADRRVTVEEHVVGSGETLWGIARQYGVPLAELQAANPAIDARRLRPGHRLMVPGNPGARTVARGRGSSAADGPSGSGVHVVEAGDTLWDLARRYRVGVNDLLRWNGLRDGAVLRPGQRLRLGGSGS